MLNFAEQTGSGAVMLVWSYPHTGGVCCFINSWDCHVNTTHKTCTKHAHTNCRLDCTHGCWTGWLLCLCFPHSVGHFLVVVWMVFSLWKLSAQQACANIAMWTHSMTKHAQTWTHKLSAQNMHTQIVGTKHPQTDCRNKTCTHKLSAQNMHTQIVCTKHAHTNCPHKTCTHKLSAQIMHTQIVSTKHAHTNCRHKTSSHKLSAQNMHTQIVRTKHACTHCLHKTCRHKLSRGPDLQNFRWIGTLKIPH